MSLASGGSSSAEVPVGSPPTLLPAFDSNDDGREQVLLSQSGDDQAQLIDYAWLDGALVRAEIDGDAPLALGLDGQGRVADY